MLQVARLAPRLLGESASLVRVFVLSQQQPDGGFADRGGRSDLYYTLFAIESLAALREPAPPATVPFIRALGAGETLDLVHLACLIRCWVAMPDAAPDPGLRARAAARLLTFRSGDGGYAPTPGASIGTAYACFLAVGALQDLKEPIDDADASELLGCLRGLRAADGAFANQPAMPAGSTPATTATIMVLRQIGSEPDPALADWLLARAHPQGGFSAAPGTPLPDLLSTATGIHALVAMHASIDRVKEPCLDFVDSLWTNRGGFYATWADDALDCEYVYYALLALGHLSL